MWRVTRLVSVCPAVQHCPEARPPTDNQHTHTSGFISEVAAQKASRTKVINHRKFLVIWLTALPLLPLPVKLSACRPRRIHSVSPSR